MDVFQLFGKIVIDGAEKAENVLSNVGSVAVKAGKVIGAGIAAGTAAVGVLAKQAISTYADFEQLAGGAELMFGSAFETVMENAKNAYSTVQMSQNEYLQQVNGFATGLKTALGGNEQAAADLAHRIIKAEADIIAATGNTAENVQNAFNGIMKSNFTMLDNLQIGITPTKEGFQEVIDKVNAWNTANGNATKYQMGNLADMQSALVDYIEMVGMSDYAQNEAAQTITGSLAATKAAWSNLLTGFADDEADLSALIKNLVGTAKQAADNLIPRIAQTLSGISDAVAEIMPVIAEELPGLLQSLLPGVIQGAVSLVIGLAKSIPAILQILIEQIPSILTQIGQGLMEAFPILLDTVKQLFGQIFDYISVGLLGIGVSFEETFLKVQEIFNGLWEALLVVWEVIGKPIFDAVAFVVDLVAKTFAAKMPEIQAFVSQCFSDIQAFWENNLKPCLTAIGNFISNVLVPIWKGVWEGVVGPVVDTVFQAIKGFWEGTLKPVFTGITDFLTGVFTLDFEKAWNGIESILKGILNGMITGVEGFINGCISAINGLIGGINNLAVVDALAGLFGVDGIPTLSLVTLPRLEEGGILEKGQMGFLEGNGAEAVVPLDQNRAWISAVAEDMNSALGGGQAVKELKEAFAAFVDELPDMLREAFESMKFDVNNREFARLVKAVN